MSESVADVLADTDDAGPLYCVATDAMDPAELSYEDWVRPLKLAGGRIVLRITRSQGRDWYVRRTDAGLLAASDGASTWRLSVRELREILSGAAAREGRVRPVLVEDSPFGGKG